MMIVVMVLMEVYCSYAREIQMWQEQEQEQKQKQEQKKKKYG
jgi:hypothetical protein